MNNIKLYNVIFPIWLLLFFPPVIFITLIGNFIIDSMVIFACYYMFRLAEQVDNVNSFYTKTISRVWLFGFLSDLAGGVILFATGILGDFLGIPYELSSALNFDPFSHPIAVVIILFAILISGHFIFLFNYNITFKKQIADKQLRLKVALTLALVTMPWTFLLPTKWFY